MSTTSRLSISSSSSELACLPYVSSEIISHKLTTVQAANRWSAGETNLRKKLSTQDFKERLFTKRLLTPVAIPALPVQVIHAWANHKAAVSRTGNSFYQHPALGLVTDKKSWTMNIPALLEVFSSIHHPDEVLPFLEVCGPFKTARPTKPQEITWSEFQQWQDFIYGIRQRKSPKIPHPSPFATSDSFQAITDPEPFFVTDQRPAHLELHPQTTLEAIGAAVFIEKLRDVELRICRLCSRLFDLTSDHERKFCTPEHARQWAKREERRKVKSKQGLEANDVNT